MNAGLTARDWYDLDCLLAKANSIQLSRIPKEIETKLKNIRIALKE